ncbi:antirestriction protein ArdA [Lentzea sp. BCCO 10_0856]|uniref:Antirestriction protein ArdA n=1 Tax=Lentzea miocenica TaxID=3095431 RepID=A0ABU4SU07_9PSEU|nr:antirestriction protein ArdA [Lentzea sp. BCCO 10_0856]MDX8029361.1 antirestriction protein ArdA [Lentzea sp. BCCO 10_0856]
MEKQPHQRKGAEQRPEVNSYGTDDPDRQAEIERARADASAERKRNRAVLESLVSRGMAPDEAEAVIEYVHSLGGQLVLDLSEAGDRSQSRPERERRYRPQVYAVDLDSQERGIQHGLWIDADQAPEAIAADIVAMLASSPTVDASKWAVGASQSFAGLDLAGCTEPKLISKLGCGVHEHGAAYAAWVAIVGTKGFDELDKFNDFYVGSYESPEAWAREVGSDLEWESHLDQVVQPDLRNYVAIDYAKFAREAMRQWDAVQGHDGRLHVFLR